MEKLCLICGDVLENRRRSTCPGECARLRKNELNVEWRARKKTGRQMKCQVCGDVVPNRPGPKYVCSEECSKIRTKKKRSEHYFNNKDLYRKRNREWRRTEKGRAHGAKELIKRKRLLEGAVQASYLRLEIAECDGWECYLCGAKIKSGDLNIDHVKPLSRGGDDAPWNVAATHSWCNFSKWASFPEAARRKSLELESLREELI